MVKEKQHLLLWSEFTERVPIGLSFTVSILYSSLPHTYIDKQQDKLFMSIFLQNRTETLDQM